MYKITNTKTGETTMVDKPWAEVSKMIQTSHRGWIAKKAGADVQAQSGAKTFAVGIYCDSAQPGGPGNPTYIRVCDEKGNDLLEAYLGKDKVSKFNGYTVYTRNGITNNFGELLGLSWAFAIANNLANKEARQVYTDSKVAISWAVNGVVPSQYKTDETFIKHLNKLHERQQDYSLWGKLPVHISGAENPADMGTHK